MDETGIINFVMEKFPHYYNVKDTSQLYKLISAITTEFSTSYVDYISRLSKCLSIDDTPDVDLEWKWGHLFNTKQMPGESEATLS